MSGRERDLTPSPGAPIVLLVSIMLFGRANPWPRLMRFGAGSRGNGVRSGLVPIALATFIAVVSNGCVLGIGPAPSVWVDNRSSQSVAFFLTDLGSEAAGWFIVPPHTTAHAGSDGLGSTAVRANVLGWGHEAGHASECSPSDYDDTLYDVPYGASVRLLIDATGQPSVAMMAEPSGLPALAAQPIMGTFNEADLCAYIRAHS
jgi:hypothetical protein